MNNLQGFDDEDYEFVFKLVIIGIVLIKFIVFKRAIRGWKNSTFKSFYT